VRKAAQVTGNVWRDLPIALMNELFMTVARPGQDTGEVLRAAGTTWNFHPYKPDQKYGVVSLFHPAMIR